MLLPSILRIAPFRRLWLGQAISLLGDSLYFLIFLFMVGKVTGDAKMVGYVGAVQAVPFLLFSPFAGVAADRFDRRRLMIAADVASAAILGCFAIALVVDSQPAVWMIFVAGFLLSTVNAFFLPAKSASVPRLVPPDRLIEANSLSAATDNLMPLIGLAFSATILGQLYSIYPNLFFLAAILLNGATFLFSAYFIAKLPPIVPTRDGQDRRRVLEDLQEGLRFIRGERVLLMTLLLGLIMNFFISPFMVVHIAANDAWFGGGYATLAWFEFAFMLGMVPASLAVGKLRVRSAGQGFIWGCAGVGVLVVLLGFAPYFWPYLLLNLVAGLILPFATIPINTYFQLVVPDGLRGRANSAMTMLSLCIRPVSIGLSGLLLAEVGLVWMFSIMGGGMVLAALLGLLDRTFRRAVIPNPEEVRSHELVPAG